MHIAQQLQLSAPFGSSRPAHPSQICRQLFLHGQPDVPALYPPLVPACDREGLEDMDSHLQTCHQNQLLMERLTLQSCMSLSAVSMVIA